MFVDIGQLIDDAPDFDGLLFYIVNDKRGTDRDPGWDEWKIVNMVFADDNVYEGTDLGQKYYVMYFNRDRPFDLIQCILTHPKTYIKQLLSQGQDACVMKKCKESDEIVDTYIKQRLNQILTNLRELAGKPKTEGM